MLVKSSSLQMARTRTYGDKFVSEMRREIERAAGEGLGVPPRLRSVHERPGHATPEFRTLLIPSTTANGGLALDVLSASIARFARQRSPDRLLLALDALREDEDGASCPVLIAEARDDAGTRLFLMQTYRAENGRVAWDPPLDGGWRDPGEEELILDAAFQRAR